MCPLVLDWGWFTAPLAPALPLLLFVPLITPGSEQIRATIERDGYVSARALRPSSPTPLLRNGRSLLSKVPHPLVGAQPCFEHH